ncbi:alpha/beta hydrolase [Gordonia sp. (in: high G+C Gram-positive bacteria)]|uniref:alpha/beta hydrolase n=1 Tax=Gordonia sp. (in: high G+C Gram-positive bacteria) TaxID=84139 RepID=UPI003526E84D
MYRLPRRVLVAVLSLLMSTIVAAPVPAAPGEARLVNRSVVGHIEEWSVYSAAMRRNIPLTVLRPADTARPAPVLYLLNGAGGGEDGANWGARTDYVTFFADKHVNVVTPQVGAFSYYTDWQRRDPRLGLQKWETFLNKELPPILGRELKSSGEYGVAGISMSGTSVLNLAIAAPRRYRAVASYSGCARTSDPLGQEYIRQVIAERGRANMENMWGPLNGPGWVAHDPFVNAAKLRGTTIYLSSNSGLPGRDESIAGIATPEDAEVLADRIVLGGGIEAAMNLCTRQMASRLASLGIPTTVVIRPEGTHSWGYWQRELHASWPTVASALSRAPRAN